MAQNSWSNFGREVPLDLPVKLFQNLSTDLAEEIISSFFLFIALAAILFKGAEPFGQF